MQLEENWHVNAPWAQLVATTKMPDELFKTTLELTDKIYEDVNRDSAGESLAGQIDNEYYITQEKLIESGLMKYFVDMVIKYWGTVLMNGNMWQYCDKKFENGPHGFDYACRIVSAWTVHQFENEYNPIHNHSNCKISAVMHLKFPEKIEPPVKEHTGGLDGNLIFKIAIPSSEEVNGSFSEKMGIFRDANGDTVAFSGTSNVMLARQSKNFESID